MRGILQGEGIPPFARHAQELVGSTLDPDSGSSNLARIILKDVGLTSQILRVANSPLYNRSGRSLADVSHAISMLGWDTVRNLVSAMRFVEHYARKSPGLRQLMMFSLLTAAHGRLVASAVGYAHPDEAYLCGLLRNLGEVVMARFHGREYADLLTIMEQERIPERVAAIRVFDFPLEDVSSRLAASWNMPPCVRICVDGGKTAATPEQKCLVSVTTYGHELTTSLYRNGAGLESVHLRTLLNPLGKQCLLVQRDLRRIVDSAVEDTRQTFQVLRIPMGSLKLVEQAEQARNALSGIELPLSCVDGVAMEAEIENLEAEISSGSFDLSDSIQKLLEILTNYCGFDCALFALMSEDRASIRGRLASGRARESAVTAFEFSLRRGDPALMAAINRSQDLWVNRKADSRYEASRIVSTFDHGQFALFPVIVDEVVAGVVYAGRNTGTGDDARTIVDRVRAAIAAGIASKRLA